jgi:hypothetical protein
LQGLLPGAARLFVPEEGEGEGEGEEGEEEWGLGLLHIVPCSVRWINCPLVSFSFGDMIFKRRLHDSN